VSVNPHPYQCRFCNGGIALVDVNVATDIALCRACGKTMQFSGIAPIPGAADMDLSRPPKGVRIEESPIRGRSIIYRKIPPVLIFLIPFTAVWSGFSMSGIYGRQISEGKFDPAASLFGLPFLIGTIVLVSVIAFMLFGRWRFSYNRGLLEVAAEVGAFGWTRRLACDKKARVSIKASAWRKNNVPQNQIHVDCQGNSLKFGAMIPDDRKHFIAEAIRRMLLES
jgi:hypothetical protein